MHQDTEHSQDRKCTVVADSCWGDTAAEEVAEAAAEAAAPSASGPTCCLLHGTAEPTTVERKRPDGGDQDAFGLDRGDHG